MKLGILLETNDPEQAWNGVRFANAALKEGHEVQLFLMSAGVEVESITHPTYDARAQLHAFAGAGGRVLACGTCLKGRQLEATEVCPLSTMVDCVRMVAWADKVVTF